MRPGVDLPRTRPFVPPESPSRRKNAVRGTKRGGNLKKNRLRPDAPANGFNLFRKGGGIRRPP